MPQDFVLGPLLFLIDIIYQNGSIFLLNLFPVNASLFSKDSNSKGSHDLAILDLSKVESLVYQ